MGGLARLALAVHAAAVAGCGAGVLPADAYDKPLFSLSGRIGPAGGIAVAGDRTGTAAARRPLATLLWTDPLQRQADVPAPAFSLRSMVAVDTDSFALDVFRPPPAGALVDVASPSGDVATLALAEIVIVDDEDADGTFRVSGAAAEIAAPDLYLAGSVTVLAYVARPFAAPEVDFPLVPTGTAGYQLLQYRCQGQVAAGIDAVSPQSVDLVLQPSLTFPELRSCRRTHSP